MKRRCPSIPGAKSIGAIAALLSAVAIVLTPAPGPAQQPPIKIGVILSYSMGDDVTLGKMADAAFAAYMKEHGDTIAGRKVEIIKRDDGGMAPETAARLAQELIVRDNVDLIVGAAYTPNAIAVGKIATQAKKPFFVVNAATSNIMKPYPYMARFGFTTAQLVGPLATWAYKTGSKTTFMIFQDYGPGIDAGNEFGKAFAAAGGKVLGEVRIPVGNRDFTAYIQRAKDAKPDALFVFINSTGGGAEFIHAYRQSGMDKAGTRLVTIGGLVDEAILPAEGDDAIGIISAYHYSALHDTPLNHTFVRDFKAAFGSDQLPTFEGIQAYDALDAAYRVIAAQKGQVDPDRTMELVRNLKFESPRGPIEIDPATRDIVQNVYLRRTERRNGLLANYEFTTFPLVHDPNEVGQ